MFVMAARFELAAVGAKADAEPERLRPTEAA